MATMMEQIERPVVTSTRQTWRIDSEASRATFAVRNRFALVSRQIVTGHFTDVSGLILLDERHPTNSWVSIEIGVARMSTGNTRRDKHLLADEFFAVDRFPTMTFDSESVDVLDSSENRFVVTGKLSIRGVERTSRFAVQFNPNESIGRPWSAQILASGTLDRGDFGMTWSNPMVRIAEGIEIRLMLRAVLADSERS